MRIAFYVGAFKENQDGATNSLYMLIHSLQACGVEVGVWTYDRNENTGNDWVEKHSVPSLPLPIYPAYRISLPQKKMIRQLLAFKPDVIHVAVPDLAGKTILRHAISRHIPVVASYHTNFVSYLKYYHLSFLAKRLMRYLADFYNQCHWVFAPTQSAMQDLEKWGVQRICLWSRGIDHRQFHPNHRAHSLRRDWQVEDRKVILFAGRFVAYKNLVALIAVYKRFQAHFPDKVRFVLLGDGPWRKKLKQTMSAAVFPGYLRDRELSGAYASADLFLFPSATETFGNVVLEALASGLPAVVSDQGGCAHIIRDSGGGLICPADDHEAFFQACRRLIGQTKLHEEMRAHGLAYAKNRSWPEINRRVIEDYQMLVAYGQPGHQQAVPSMIPRLKKSVIPQQDTVRFCG